MTALAILFVLFVIFTIRAIYVTKNQRKRQGENGGCWIFFF